MEIFEIHITGDKHIIQICKYLNLKAIVVDLLDKDLKTIRTEYMTSIVRKFDNYDQCKKYVDDLVEVLQFQEQANIIRVKIESPYYDHYVGQSKYMETHFVSNDNKLPLSRNQNKTTLLATDRVYNISQYDDFMSKYQDIELCLFDSYVEEDFDWLKL